MKFLQTWIQIGRLKIASRILSSRRLLSTTTTTQTTLNTHYKDKIDDGHTVQLNTATTHTVLYLT